MDANKLFPSKYIAACDLDGKDKVVTIKDVALEEVKNASSSDTKGIIYYAEFEKGMVLNKTNGKRIIALHGNETDAWAGQQITLYPSETDMAGETVPCIRVRPERPA